MVHGEIYAPYLLGPLIRLVVILERYFEMDCCSKNKKEIFKNGNQIEYGEVFHRWSDFVYSFNPVTIPSEMKWKLEISETFIQEISGAEFGRLRDGILLVNENNKGWESRKDLLVALDMMPHLLLLDIFRMESERYKNQKPDIKGIEEPGEKVRRLLYFSYIPEIIRSHSESNKKHI